MKNYKLLLTGLVLVAGFFLFGVTNNSFATIYMVWPKTPANTHEFTRLPLDINGWTDFRYMIKEQNLYHDARVVFVSSSEGSDSDGQFYGVEALTFDEHGIFLPIWPVNAYATLAEAAKQLRDGYPDIMLLKRGDEWIEPLPVGGWPYVNRSGRSEARAIYASYGTESAKPVLRPFGNVLGSMSASNIIFSSFTYYVAHRDPYHPDYQSSSQDGNKLRMMGKGADILFEDIHTHFAHWELDGRKDTPGEYNRVVVRRCFIEKSYTLEAEHVQGLWASNVVNLVLEESAWYHNGWRADLNNSTQFNQNIYLSSEVIEPTTRYNFSIRASGAAIQQRGGGVAVGNVYSHNPGSIRLGYGDNPVPGGTKGVFAYNVDLSSVDYPHGKSLGSGPGFGNLYESHILENIVTDNISGSHSRGGFGVVRYTYGDQITSVDNITFENNIVFNRGAGRFALSVDSSADFLSNMRLIGNEFDVVSREVVRFNPGTSSIVEHRDNKYNTTNSADNWFSLQGLGVSLATWNSTFNDTGSTAFTPNYHDPYRTLATYSASLGYDETLEAFVDELRKQQRTNWRDVFTSRATVNYIRAGFGRGPMPEEY